MPTLHHAGAAIHYTTLGEQTGRTLTLIHGAGGNAMSWWQNAPCFAAQGQPPQPTAEGSWKERY